MEKVCCLVELYATENGSIHQCNKKNCFFVDFKGVSSFFKVHDFFNLKKMLDNVDIDEMILCPTRAKDLEIISPLGCDRCFVLTLKEVVEFKELLSGAKVMLELNSILYKNLYCVTF